MKINAVFWKRWKIHLLLSVCFPGMALLGSSFTSSERQFWPKYVFGRDDALDSERSTSVDIHLGNEESNSLATWREDLLGKMPGSGSLALQNVSNHVLMKLSKFRIQVPMAIPIESSFPVDSSIIGRMQRGRLTDEEARLLRGKRLVVIGDSLDGNLLLNLILTCPRAWSEEGMKLKSPSFAGISCNFFSRGDKMYETYNVMVVGKFHRYDFEIVLHRATYGIEPLKDGPDSNHPAFKKGRVKPSMSLKEMYSVILEETVAHLPDKHRADVVLFNVNLWVRYREILDHKRYTEDEVETALAAFYEAAKEFFKPSAMAFHSIPEVDRPDWKATHLNNYVRRTAQNLNAGLFDWQSLTSEMYGKGMKKDKKHPNYKLNARFGAMMMAWLLDIFKSM